MKKPLIIANWKMNQSQVEAKQFCERIVQLAPDTAKWVLCAPFVYIPAVATALEGSDIAWGAQNLYTEDKGAYTGEISATMLRDFHCKYVIVGHSERREYFNESDEFVNKKAEQALLYGLTPVICVGESLAQREAGEAKAVIERQVKAATQFVDCSKIVIAYEPIWAIGTGKTASPEEANEVHQWIRALIDSDRTPIVYGGSVNPKNAKSLLSMPNIDGALVGGASLALDSFLSLASDTE